MLTASEVEGIAKEFVPEILGYMEERISKALEDFSETVETLREQLFAMRQQNEQLSEELALAKRRIEELSGGLDLEEAARRASELVPVPQNGKSVDPEEVRAMILEQVEAIELPEVDLDEVARRAAELVPVPEDGKDGESVDQDQVRAMVADAVKEIDPPKDGEPGRDALSLEVLPDIDPEKSYPRGTYASHGGGLWRAFEKTHGFRGWECLVDGVADIEVDQDGTRGVTVKATRSSGQVVEKSFRLPVMQYRGIFTPGPYEPGDVVTWAGSAWHCFEETNDKPGEPGSKGWTLAVKRGRDGKDGINGRDKTKGVKADDAGDS